MLYTAHIRESDGARQTVNAHCTSVAALAETYAEKLGMSNFAYLQGIIHDFGKLTKDFNDYINGQTRFSRGEIDHSYAGAKYIRALAEKMQDKDIVDSADLIAHTVATHHGLRDWLNQDGEDTFTARISKNDRYEEICSNTYAVIQDDELKQRLQKSATEFVSANLRIRSICDKDPETYAFYNGMLERLMLSVLVDADRTDTADFESGTISNEFSDTNKLWQNMHYRMEDKCNEFRKLTTPVSVQRMIISDKCAEFAGHKVGVCRLIVPTGGGKTLSSLRFAIEYCKKYDMEKIFYIAPFMSILEQNSNVFRSIAGEENFLEHHSNVEIETDAADTEELSACELHTEKWDLPVIATTLVQFLDTLFLGRMTSVRRMHRLCKSVIIIDEVQAIPVKCVYLFNLAINFLARICDCAVVLCSATQPPFENIKYPLLTDENCSMTGDYTKDFAALRRTSLVSCLKENGYTYDETAEFCLKKHKENGNLLLIVNTKAAANAIYCRLNKLAGGDAVVHLSTNMCPQHRRETIELLQGLLKSGKRVICVTTQLIEAGVDISFRCVVRSLAGIDNAAQAAGRCNRHGEYGLCNTYIINLSEEKLGSLQEIKCAQAISTQIITTGSHDLLAVDTMTRYFKKYYTEQSTSLPYPVTDIGVSTNIIRLLALNNDRYMLKKHGTQPHSQAFATAGKLFSVLGDNTTCVIVPYEDKANEIIRRLNDDIMPNEASALLRKAQKYTVGLYPNDYRKLWNASTFYKLKCGAMAMRKEFYDSVLGVTATPEINEDLFF